MKDALATILVPLQLLVVALTLGPAFFVGVLSIFGFGPRADVAAFGDFITHSAIAVAVVAIIINVVLSVACRRAAGPDGSRASVCLAARTVGGALVFAFAGFFTSVAMMLEQSYCALVLAICMIVGAASRFPTKSLARRWLPGNSEEAAEAEIIDG